MENPFLKDACHFTRKAAAIIEDDLPDEDVIDGILFFGLGAERILKSILFELNPVYVYKSQDFKNTMAILYQDRLLPAASRNQEIARNPDAEVLTFKLSLLRAQAISQVTHDNSSLLFSLSNWRDIVAHCDLSQLDLDKCRSLLLRDFYPLMVKYSQELKIPPSRVLGSYDIKLSSLSAKHQESTEDKVRLKLESHMLRWKQLSSVAGYADKMNQKTNEAAHRKMSELTSVDLVDCPACENPALLFSEADVDVADGQAYICGVFVSGLRCLFCKLEISDYDEVDHLKLLELIIPDEDLYM